MKIKNIKNKLKKKRYKVVLRWLLLHCRNSKIFSWGVARPPSQEHANMTPQLKRRYIMFTSLVNKNILPSPPLHQPGASSKCLESWRKLSKMHVLAYRWDGVFVQITIDALPPAPFKTIFKIHLYFKD